MHSMEKFVRESGGQIISTLYRALRPGLKYTEGSLENEQPRERDETSDQSKDHQSFARMNSSL